MVQGLCDQGLHHVKVRVRIYLYTNSCPGPVHYDFRVTSVSFRRGPGDPTQE